MRYFIATCCLLFLGMGILIADNDTTNAFIFSLDGAHKKAMLFEDYRHISFTDNGFIASPNDKELKTLTILYKDFNRIAFERFDGVGVDEIPVSNELFVYDKSTNLLSVIVDNPESYKIGVYSVDGILVSTGYGSVTLNGAASGVYIAVATNGTSKLLLKFSK